MKKFAFALALLVALSFTGCGNNESSQPSEAISSDTSSSYAEKEPSVVSSEPESSQEEPESSQEEPESSQQVEPIDFEGIPGSHYTDIVLNLEKRGFPDHESGATYCMATQVLADGVTYSYSLAKNRKGEIISGSFSFTDLTGMSADECIKFAQPYLSFCSTFPYETKDTEAAQKFVDDHVADTEAEMQIGDALFTINTTSLNSGTDITMSVKYNPE